MRHNQISNFAGHPTKRWHFDHFGLPPGTTTTISSPQRLASVQFPTGAAGGIKNLFRQPMAQVAHSHLRMTKE
jgi:adenine deaminase